MSETCTACGRPASEHPCVRFPEWTCREFKSPAAAISWRDELRSAPVSRPEPSAPPETWRCTGCGRVASEPLCDTDGFRRTHGSICGGEVVLVTAAVAPTGGDAGPARPDETTALRKLAQQLRWEEVDDAAQTAIADELDAIAARLTVCEVNPSQPCGECRSCLTRTQTKLAARLASSPERPVVPREDTARLAVLEEIALRWASSWGAHGRGRHKRYSLDFGQTEHWTPEEALAHYIATEVADAARAIPREDAK